MSNNNIKEILKDVKHRPWQIPNKPWKYYQEWNDALFLHFEIDENLLKRFLPKKLIIDKFDNKAYLSIVIFKMEKIRSKNLPSISFISDFYEVNLRTYIEIDGKKGVYFLNIEAEKFLSAYIAKKLSGLPYEKSKIKRTINTYLNTNKKKGFYLKTSFSKSDLINNKTLFDLWITERYCLYLDKKDKLVRFEIHHKEWELYDVNIHKLKLRYKIKNLFNFNEKSLIGYHYSPGVKVLSWKEETVI